MKAITDQINEQNLFKAKAAVETQVRSWLAAGIAGEKR
jgi:hypothetical protein